MVQTSNAFCEREEVGELGAINYCEPDVWEGNSVCVPLNSIFSLKNGAKHV